MQKFEIKISHIFILSAVFHILAVIMSKGFFRPDEQLGIINNMGYKLGMVSRPELSWEVDKAIRPWIQPGFYFIISKVLIFTGLKNPFNIALILRLVSSLIGFISFYYLYTVSKKTIIQKKDELLFAAILFLSWFIPFWHARTNNENLSTSFLALILALFLNRKINFLIGLLIAITFYLRFQMAFFFVPFLWYFIFIDKIKFNQWMTLVLGFTAGVLLNTFIDYWGYGFWAFTPYNYFKENIINGVASGFGTSPWYDYFKMAFNEIIAPISLIFILTFLYYWYKNYKNILAQSSFIFFLGHVLVGHKEFRFLFPLFIFFPYFFIEIKNLIKPNRLTKFIIVISLIVNVILLILSTTRTAFGPISFYEYMYQKQTTDKIDNVYTLSVFRDQLTFYLHNNFKQIDINEDQIQNIILNNKTSYFLMNKYEHSLILDKIPQCHQEYSQYPKTTLSLLKKINMIHKAKTWFFYECK